MDEDVPRADIDAELERAEQMLSDAKQARQVGISKATVVNRLYYACVHATRAALYARGHDPRSHGQVVTLVGSELVQGGSLDRSLGRFLNDMETYRGRVDFGTGAVERDSSELIEETEALLEAMRDIVEA